MCSYNSLNAKQLTMNKMNKFNFSQKGHFQSFLLKKSNHFAYPTYICSEIPKSTVVRPNSHLTPTQLRRIFKQCIINL